MPEQRFFIKKNDTLKDLTATLRDGDFAVVDLTGITAIVFNMRDASGTVKIDNVTAAVVVAASGTVKYEWVAADTDTAGEFDGEFEVTFGAGGILTFPNATDIRITIRDEVA